MRSIQVETNEWIDQLKADAQNKQPSIIENLIKQKVLMSFDERTALASIINPIILNDDVKSLEILLRFYKDLHIGWKYYKSLEFALLKGCKSVARYFLSEKYLQVKKFSGKQGFSLLTIATEQDDINSIMTLLKVDANPFFTAKYGVLPIFIAAKNGNVKIVQRFLGEALRELIKGGLGLVLLNVAAEVGDLDSIILLAEAGANPNLRHSYPFSPLKLAARGGHKKIVNWLWNFKSDQGERPSDLEKFEALCYATERGHLSCIKILMDEGIRVKPLSSDEAVTLLGKAAENKHHEIVEYLISQISFLLSPAQLRMITYIAIENGSFDCIRILHRYGADLFAIYPDGSTLLIVAARKSYAEIISYLLEVFNQSQSDISKWINYQLPTGETALYFAAVQGDWQSVRELIQAGAITSHVCVDGFTTLMAAVYNRHILVVNELLGHEAHNETMKSIDQAAKGCRYKWVARNLTVEEFNLIRLGSLIVFEKKGLTWWLHFRNDRSEICKTLIENSLGKDYLKQLEGLTYIISEGVTLEDEVQMEEIIIFNGIKLVTKGETAVYRAIKNGDIHCLSRLIKAGADLRLACGDGTTPSIAAAQNKDSTTLHLLLRQKSVLDTVPEVFKEGISVGSTLLFLSIEQGHWDCVYPLLRAGACTNVQDEGERTPLSMALEIKKYDMVILLLLYGGKVAEIKKELVCDEEQLVAAFKKQALIFRGKSFRKRCINFLEMIETRTGDVDPSLRPIFYSAVEKGSLRTLKDYLIARIHALQPKINLVHFFSPGHPKNSNSSHIESHYTRMLI